MPRTRTTLLLLSVGVCLLAQNGALQGWYPHEGGLMKYRVQIRVGEEPDTLPDGWKFGHVSSVATASAGLVYVFQRGPKADPLVVFDAKGKYVRSWGMGMFGNPHGLPIDKQDHVWITDNGYHQVMEFTNTGKLLRTWGVKGQPGIALPNFSGLD